MLFPCILESWDYISWSYRLSWIHFPWQGQRGQRGPPGRSGAPGRDGEDADDGEPGLPGSPGLQVSMFHCDGGSSDSAKFRKLIYIFIWFLMTGSYFTNAGLYVRGQLPKYWLWQLILYLQLFSNVLIICSCWKSFWPIVTLGPVGIPRRTRSKGGKRWWGEEWDIVASLLKITLYMITSLSRDNQQTISGLHRAILASRVREVTLETLERRSAAISFTFSLVWDHIPSGPLLQWRLLFTDLFLSLGLNWTTWSSRSSWTTSKCFRLMPQILKSTNQGFFLYSQRSQEQFIFIFQRHFDRLKFRSLRKYIFFQN